MSYPDQPPPPQGGGGGGNFLTSRYMGIPGIVWLAGAAVVAYFLFFRNKSSSGAGGTSTGGGGTATTGDIQLQPGTETIDLTGTTAATGTGVTDASPVTGGTSTTTINQPGGPVQTGTQNPQPTPAPPPRTKFTWYTVQRGDTLKSVAKRFGISVATLAHANVYVPGEVPGDKKVGQPLGTGAGLKTGQRLHVPLPG